MGTKFLKQQREGTVEFVAEAAAPPGDDLGDQVGLVQGDGLAQVNAQVLERHGALVRQMQRAERGRVQYRGPAGPDAVQVSGQSLAIHNRRLAIRMSSTYRPSMRNS